MSHDHDELNVRITELEQALAARTTHIADLERRLSDQERAIVVVVAAMGVKLAQDVSEALQEGRPVRPTFIVTGENPSRLVTANFEVWKDPAQEPASV